jgi:hypothetical protein
MKRFFAAASINSTDADSIQKVHVDPVTILIDGDVCLVGTSSQFETYVLDADSGQAESSQDVLLPFGETGPKRWIRHVDADIVDAVLKKHEHANKALIDTYSQTNANIGDAITKKHAQLCASADFTKLGGIEVGANKYVHPAAHVITEVTGLQTALDGKSDDGHIHDGRYYTEAETDQKIAALVESAPETLDTLNELAAALDDDPNFATTVATQIGTKVDKVAGKGLSTNDYTDAEQTKLTGIAAGAQVNTIDAGGGLAALDATADTKLEGIETGANKYAHPVTHPAGIIVQDAANRFFTDTERTKLTGIATGANKYVHPTAHTIAEVTGLQGALDGKSDTGHGHAIGDTSGLQTALDGKSATSHNHDSKYLGISAKAADSEKLDGVNGGDFLKKSEDYVAGHHAEGRALISASLTNDFGNLRHRGGEFIFTNISPGDNTIDYMFDGLSTFLSMAVASTTFPVVIEFTLPRKLTYSAYIGIGFGSTSWRTNGVKIEAFSEGGWVTVVDTITNSSEDIFAQIPGNSSIGTTKVRYTLTDPNTTSVRICHLWGYNYNSAMWSELQMPRVGGKMYGSLEVEGDVTLSGTVDSRDLTADGTKLDGIATSANLYTHPANHPGSIITQDSTHRFATDTEKTTWNDKSNLALGETSVTAYRGDRGKTGYDHSQVAHAPTGAQVNTIDAGDGLAALDSAADTKLDGIATSANNYSHPATHPPSIIVQDITNRFVTDAEKAAWTAKSDLALGETLSTAYRGDLGKLGYDHSKILHAPSNANYYEHPATHPASVIVQDASNRFFTDTERTKLTGIATGANLYSHPANHAIAVITGLQTALDGKSATTHVHDSRYYTESEVNALLAGIGGGAKFKTGQYTGNGSTSQAITGVGFTPRYVAIRYRTTSSADGAYFIRTDQEITDYCMVIKGEIDALEVPLTQMLDDCIISLDADGFTVDDIGNPGDPNYSGRTYIYVAIG